MGFSPNGGSISGATDVALSNPANNQVLTYDGTTQLWKNANPGSGSNPTMGGDLSGTASAAQIVANAVSATELAANAVTTAKILDANVTGAKIADDAVTEPKLNVSNTPATSQVLSWNGTALAWATPSSSNPTLGGELSGTASAATIVASAVTTSKLATSAVTTVKIADANITTAKILDANVTGAKIADGSITEPKLAVSNTPSTDQVLGWNGTAMAWTPPTSGGSNPGVINVKDYGAVGNGSTDDTTAIINARNAVWATAAANEGYCAKKLYFPGGRYKVTQPGALLSSPDVAGGSQGQIRGYEVIGDGKRSSQIVYSNTAAAAAGKHPANNALFIAGNRVSQFRVTKISFESTNAVNTCFFFWSRTNADTDYDYPEYGWGNNQDIIFHEVEITGPWRWGVLLDGDKQANLNSEFFLYNCAITTTTSFTAAFFQSGYTDYANNDQQDQFLNYSFIDCKFEYMYGDCLVFNRGGNVNVRGGSVIFGISDPSKIGGAFFKNSLVAFHNLSAQQATFTGVRFELRHENCSMIDSGWYGGNAHISLIGCNDTGVSWQSHGPLVAGVILRANGGRHANLYAQNCSFGGHWEILGNQSTPANSGRVVLDMCGFQNFTGGVSTTTANTGFLQYNGTTVPKYRYRDCTSVADVSN